MTARKNTPDRGSGSDELVELVAKLQELQQRIADLSEGEVDAVSTSQGQPFLLPAAQSHVLAEARVQLRIAAERAAVLNALPAYVALLDAEGHVLALNEPWTRAGDDLPLAGGSIVEGQNYIDACVSAIGTQSDDIGKTLRAVLSGKRQEYHIEYAIDRPDGARWYQLTVNPLRDEQRSGAVAMHVDITDRKLVEEELRVTEERFRRTFVDAAIGMAITSSQGRVLAANNAFCRMVGYREQELFDLEFPTLIHQEDRLRHRRLIEQLFAGTRDSFIIEKRFVTKDGGVVWVRASVAALRNLAEEPVGTIGVVEDITQQRDAEIALHEATRRIETLMGNLPGMVFRCKNDRDWTMEFVSAGVTELTGYTRGDLLPGGPTTYAGLIDPEDAARVWSNVQAAVRERTPFELVYRLHCQDGTRKWVWKKGQAVYDEAGNVHSLEGFISDISEQIEAQESLRQSEALLSSASQISRLGAWAIAVPTMSLTWSDEIRTIHEVDEDYVPTVEAAVEFYAPEYVETIRRLVNACIEDGEPFDVELQIITAKGRRVWVRSIGKAVRDHSGEIIRVDGAFQDISDRKAAEQSLRMSEERFRVLSNATNDAVWDWDLATNSLWWNDGFESTFGNSGSEIELTSASWTSRIHPDDLDVVLMGIHSVIDGGSTHWSAEYRFRRKDGTYAAVFDRGHVVRDASGRGIRMVGGMTDQTKRKEAEARLAQQAALIDQASDAILVCDMDYRVLSWNHGAQTIYGWSSEEIRGQSLADFLYKDAGQLAAASEALLDRGEWSDESEHVTKDGSKVTALVRSNLLRDDAGQPKSILAIHTNITDRKRLEQQLLRAQRMDSIGMFAGGMAHDLNNVLAPILMAVDVLGTTITDDEDREILATVKESALHGAALIRQVLGFARGVAGSKSRVNPGNIVKEVERVIRDTFPRGIAVESSVPHDIWSISADSTQMHQVVMNLCINARDAMPSGGRLKIELENAVLDEVFSEVKLQAAPGAYVILRVEDSGAGIPKDVQERVFEPFFTTKAVGEGTGLGLSTTFSIVRDHGGFIHLYSEIDKGTKFEVYLPACATEAGTEEVAIVRTNLPRGDGDLVLLVDDEQNVRDITRRALERYGYKVVTANHGAEAVALYVERRGEIAVVLTDMSMPIMDGPALAVALKSIDPDVKIIGSSGLVADGHVAKAVGAGVEYFVPKPYTAEVLLTMLDQILNPGAVQVPLHSRVEIEKPVSASKQTPAPTPSAAEKSEQGVTMLIVDDEASIVRLVKRFLEFDGHHVHTAGDGASALSILATGEPAVELVLTDLTMPGTGGAELAREIVRQHPHVRLIIMSGGGDLARIARDIGPNVRSISKPFSLEDLRVVIREATASPDAGSESD